MPRKLRSHYKNAFYHVMLRGNFRQNIFFDENDRDFFLDILKSATLKYSCKIHLFCLMTNHIHLVIQIDLIPLSKIIQHISSVYARKINKKYGRVGHLFQGRYAAETILSQDYLIQLCYYIHNNPVSAKIVANVQDYPWSSHHCYSGKVKIKWLTTDYILNILSLIFSESSDRAYEYLFTAKGKDKCEKEIFNHHTNGDLILVDEIAKSLNHFEKKDLSSWKISDFAKIICGYLNVAFGLLDSESQNRNITFARNLIAYFAHYRAHFTLKQIGIYFKRQPDTMSRNIHRALKYRKTHIVIEQIEREILKHAVLDTDT